MTRIFFKVINVAKPFVYDKLCDIYTKEQSAIFIRLDKRTVFDFYLAIKKIPLRISVVLLCRVALFSMYVLLIVTTKHSKFSSNSAELSADVTSNRMFGCRLATKTY